MAKATRSTATEPSRSEHIERLTDAVNHLADEVRVARDVMDEIREDFGWVTRNGIPGRNNEHTQLVRMARDPLSPDANKRLEVRTSKLSPSSSAGLSETRFEELVSEITEAIAVVGQEQVNVLLTALDDARTKLLAAIKSPSAAPKPSTTSTTSERPVPIPTDKPTKPAQFF